MATPARTLLIIRHRWTVLLGALAVMAVSALVAGDVSSRLSAGGFIADSAESSQATALIAERFDDGVPNLVLVVEAHEPAANADGATVDTVDTQPVAAAASTLVAELAGEDGIVEVASYWSLGQAPSLRSRDGTQALVLARINGDENQVQEVAARVHDTYDGEYGPLTIDVGGEAVILAMLTETLEEDLLTAELIAVPITLVLLVLVFGSVVAGLLPLAVGGFAILGTFLALRLVTTFAEVSIYALNFTTAIGLGLAIDYSLLVVSRYREELAAGLDAPEALQRTLRTAGRTVIVSAATVASALVALLVFEIAFLRSFAYAGIAVVALAAIGAVVVLPAMLALIGTNIERLRVRQVRVRADGDGIWHRIATTVMRRPIPIATVVITVLMFVGAPFLNLQLGFPDDRVMQEGAEGRTVGETLRANFDPSEASAATVVMDGVDVTDPAASAAIADYALALSSLDDVARVDAATGTYQQGQLVAPATAASTRLATDETTYLSVIPSIEALSVEAEALVAQIRAMEPPYEALVGGLSAELVDGKADLMDRLPLALSAIAGITFILLFLQFGSLLVPLKAIVLNLLSLSATFGAMVWIFQEGNLANVFGFTATGTIVTTMPVLMFCIAFGLSMDYEVFLLSRIKEEYDRTGDNTRAVAMGLEKTGRIVTAAAVLISVVFLAFASSRVSFMQLFGLGMALAVLVDAFLIRATLMPAFMRLAGDANWWAPAPLRRLHQRIGISELAPLDPPAQDREPTVVPTPV